MSLLMVLHKPIKLNLHQSFGPSYTVSTADNSKKMSNMDSTTPYWLIEIVHTSDSGEGAIHGGGLGGPIQNPISAWLWQRQLC
jgi:hypothetical protein